MKYGLPIFIVICFCACAVARKSAGKDKELFDRIYESQKSYCDSSVKVSSDFAGVLRFGKKKRFDLYRQNSLVPIIIDTCIILEGFANGWGKYVGLFIRDDRIFLYKNKPHSAGWDCSWVNAGDKNFEAITGVTERTFNIIKTWDTGYVNSLKGKIGSYVYDGYSFIATRVIRINNGSSNIESIAFYEFR